MEGEQISEGSEEGVPLLEGWMFGALLYPHAMAEVVRVPPANDREELQG
ncbi:MAG TPA: hypothetical protein VE684_10855 [Crenalkalicoccus sp.]|jgi:hypothetical protein|nr:hypothetical protein [Crenalkalicoccus sp.]